MINDKAKRIIENIYDLMNDNIFYKNISKREMKKDLSNHNIMVDKNNGIIEIQDTTGNRVLYTITIKQGR